MTITSALKTGSLKFYLLLSIIVLLSYWPLTFGVLSLKNDALVQYLAFRYHLSESIQHGYFPFWSPYLYTGFPIHEDIQGMVWNPVVLTLSLISRYNMTVLQWEVLIYLLLAAFGMFRLIRWLGCNASIAFVCAVAYVGCGKITDGISILPYTASAAFIPFVIQYFLQLYTNPVFKNAVKYSMALCLLFLCGYPSFFIFLHYLLLIGTITFHLFGKKKPYKQSVLRFAGWLATAYLIFLCVCSPAIASFYEFLPYYSRGSGLDYAKSTTNLLPAQSLFSLILPNAVGKATFLDTDMIMRNSYIGLFLLFFFIVGLFRRKTAFKKSMLLLIFFALLFSLGDQTPLHKFCYRFLPLINTFRHPADMRLFTAIGMIMLAAFTMNQYNRAPSKLFQRICIALCVLLSGIMAYLLFAVHLQSPRLPTAVIPSEIKRFMDELNFWQFVLFISLIQLIFLLIYLARLRSKKLTDKSIIFLFVLNTVVFVWIALPFTVVSQYSTKQVNEYLASFPSGYPIPDVGSSVESEIISDSVAISVHGYHNFYNKKITIQDHVITPTLNSAYVSFFKNLPFRNKLKGYPFVYFTAAKQSVGAKPEIKINAITPNSFNFTVKSSQPGVLHLFQQYHHNWRVVVNNKKVPVMKDNIAFMAIQIPQGMSIIDWNYHPTLVYYAISLSLLTILTLVFVFLIIRYRKTI